MTLLLVSGDGIHQLFISLEDQEGNSFNQIFTFITDDTPPDLTINLLDHSVQRSGTVIDGQPIETNNITLTLYNWDGSVNITISNENITIPVGDGLHTFRVYFLDEAGNWGSFTFVFICHVNFST